MQAALCGMICWGNSSNEDAGLHGQENPGALAWMMYQEKRSHEKKSIYSRLQQA
jgi:hypothetical protein